LELVREIVGVYCAVRAEDFEWIIIFLFLIVLVNQVLNSEPN